VGVIDVLVNLPSPHLVTPTRPSTPKVLQAKERTPTPSPSIIFTFGLVVESIVELGGVSLALRNAHRLQVLRIEPFIFIMINKILANGL
jgi:hypothetical protein